MKRLLFALSMVLMSAGTMLTTGAAPAQAENSVAICVYLTDFGGLGDHVNRVVPCVDTANPNPSTTCADPEILCLQNPTEFCLENDPSTAGRTCKYWIVCWFEGYQPPVVGGFVTCPYNYSPTPAHDRAICVNNPLEEEPGEGTISCFGYECNPSEPSAPEPGLICP